jgi:Family of unknown function (DUF6064)
MFLPFSADEFFEVFRRYNESVWPAQFVMTVLAIAAVPLLRVNRRSAARGIAAILGVLWLWTGLVYHGLHFSRINSAAVAFGALSVIAGLAFLWCGTVKGVMPFRAKLNRRTFAGALLIVYALLGYPALSLWAGHAYPAVPTFGTPCPTTLFTLGMLCFLVPPYPRLPLVGPVLWTIVGSQAAFFLGVVQDLALIPAGILGVLLILRAGKCKHIDGKSKALNRTSLGVPPR